MPGATAPVRVLHLTDPHLFADTSATLRGTATFASLEGVLSHYRESSWVADVVALTGDLTQDESHGAYANISALLEPLGLPILTVPGNHDVRDAMQTTLGTPPFAYCTTMRHGNWLLIGIDSCVEGVAHGEVDPRELERLHAAVTESDARHALVCLHHPPVEVGSRWLDAVGLRNAAQFLTALAELESVRGLLFGHVHQSVETAVAGVKILGTPSTCRQFKPASHEFAVDDRPPAYRQVELFADGKISHELVWVGPRV